MQPVSDNINIHNTNINNNSSKIFGRDLAIACLNINSLSLHLDELRIYMNISKLDILAINETKLVSSISNCELDITGYDIVRLDREDYC